MTNAMNDRHVYYTLVASLPALPDFEEAEVLPINAERLQERMRILAPGDFRRVREAVELITWHRQPRQRTDPQTVKLYHDLAEDEQLREIVVGRANVRAVGAALRRKRLGQPAPSGQREPWAAGPFVRHIERHWEDPNFKLEHVFPWIPEMREHLNRGESVAAERLFLRIVWNQVSRQAEGREFELVAVLAYLFKWDIVRRWLSYDEQDAETRVAGLSDRMEQQIRSFLS